jgi:hypothetical protein
LSQDVLSSAASSPFPGVARYFAVAMSSSAYFPIIGWHLDLVVKVPSTKSKNLDKLFCCTALTNHDHKNLLEVSLLAKWSENIRLPLKYTKQGFCLAQGKMRHRGESSSQISHRGIQIIVLTQQRIHLQRGIDLNFSTKAYWAKYFQEGESS